MALAGPGKGRKPKISRGRLNDLGVNKISSITPGDARGGGRETRNLGLMMREGACSRKTSGAAEALTGRNQQAVLGPLRAAPNKI